MHRHGYKGRKFGRERDQREALLKGLADSLIREESIETTLPKAKELVPYVEKLITKAKQADLSSRRLIIRQVSTLASAHKLVDLVAPKLKHRQSGHLRVERTGVRRGDHVQMAKVSFIDDLRNVAKTTPKLAAEAASKPVPKKKVTSKS